MKILVADDDALILEGLVELLTSEGYEVIAAENGEVAYQQFRQCQPDFVILDIMMPKRSGYDVCRDIRRDRSTVPILFLSAKSEEIDKVIGLELGADDFMMKPFGIREMLARIRAIVRRCHVRDEPPRVSTAQDFDFGRWRIVHKRMKASAGTFEIDLSQREIKILRILAENTGCVIDRNTMFDLCWGQNYLPNSRTLDQHISQLRKKIELNPRVPELIKTVHGVGYRYDG